MTVKETERTTAELAFTILERLKRSWMLVTFAIGAFFWAEAQWERFATLPEDLFAHVERLETLERRLDSVEGGVASDRTRQGLEPDLGRASLMPDGEWTVVRLTPGETENVVCGPVSLAARMFNGSGPEFEARITTREAMRLGDGALHFATPVESVDPQTQPGHAMFGVEITRRCSGKERTAALPSLGFGGHAE